MGERVRGAGTDLEGRVITLARHAGDAGIAWSGGTELSSEGRAHADAIASEVVATAGLVVLIPALHRTGPGMLAAPAIGTYTGAA